MVWVQKWPFFQFFLLGNRGQQTIFYQILEPKNAFLGYKKKSSKSRKIDIFPKGLTHGLAPNMAIFKTFFFLGNIGQENVCYDILKRKTPLKAIKTRSSKSRKIDIFPRGLTHGLGPKMAIFQTSFLRQYRPGKCLL